MIVFNPSKPLFEKINEAKPLYMELFQCAEIYNDLDRPTAELQETALFHLKIAAKAIKEFRDADPFFTYDMQHEINRMAFKRCVLKIGIAALKMIS